MRFLRNTEFRVELILLTILFVAAIIGMYMQCGTIAAVYLLIFCGVIFCLYISYSVVKYRKMASLAEQIDRILHGEELQIMEHCCEGEFAVLATSIDKMVQRMLEQQSILQKEKVFLADSMADISHQMKTPLTSISLLLNLLQEEHLSEKKRLQYVQDLMKLTGRIDWMVYALLRLAKLDAGTVQLQQVPYQIEDLIKAAVTPLEIALDIRDITLEVQMQPDLQHRGDISWMTEAVSNILKNCMEHTPSGGHIRIVTKDNPLYLLIKITDSGSGLPNRIFRTFLNDFTADKMLIQTALALALLWQNVSLLPKMARSEPTIIRKMAAPYLKFECIKVLCDKIVTIESLRSHLYFLYFVL